MLEDAIKELVGPEHAAAALDGSAGASGSSEVSCSPLAGVCSSLKSSFLHVCWSTVTTETLAGNDPCTSCRQPRPIWRSLFACDKQRVCWGGLLPLNDLSWPDEANAW
jgi:hypothetical protein